MPGQNNPFDKNNFPPTPDPMNEETGIRELYPESNQDEVNASYNHNKVLPRQAGVDFTPDNKGYSETQPEDHSTFPYKY